MWWCEYMIVWGIFEYAVLFPLSPKHLGTGVGLMV